MSNLPLIRSTKRFIWESDTCRRYSNRKISHLLKRTGKLKKIWRSWRCSSTRSTAKCLRATTWLHSQCSSMTSSARPLRKNLSTTRGVAFTSTACLTTTTYARTAPRFPPTKTSKKHVHSSWPHKPRTFCTVSTATTFPLRTPPLKTRTIYW